ncbi:MAG: hypothetical protein M1816_004939 [Peltula sp. TS41687]|nr:MAG: hypothetical protein M1816_004939 [Peltula sp. TS41687]
MGLFSFLTLGLTGSQWALGCFAITSIYLAVLLPRAQRRPAYLDLAELPNLRYKHLQQMWHAIFYEVNRVADMLKGSKIRVSPDGVLFQSAKAFSDIYSARSNVHRSKVYAVWRRNEQFINTLTANDVAVHRRKRRILNTVFMEKSLRAASLYVNRHVDRWNELLLDGDGEDWSQPKDLTEWSDYLIFDILGDLCFGRSFETKEPGDNPLKIIPHAIHSYLRFNYPVSSKSQQKGSSTDGFKMTLSPLIDLFLWLKPRGLDSLLEAVTPKEIKYYYKFLEQSVLERQKLEEESQRLNEGKEVRQDMFHFLFQAKNPDTGELALSEQELFAEANLLVIAGSDTTSSVLCGFFFYISRNKRVYDKLVREIRTTFDSAEEIVSGAKLSSCHYLRACLDEAMRLTPAAPNDLPRTVLPGGQMIDGDFYPEGIIVGRSGWAAGRNDELGDPNVYRPERWIENEEAGVTGEDVKHLRNLVHPFIAGPTNCVGQNLAILELLTTTARTLYRMDLRQAPGSTLGEGAPELGWGRRDRNQFQLVDAFVALRQGPMLQFRKRQFE